MMRVGNPVRLISAKVMAVQSSRLAPLPAAATMRAARPSMGWAVKSPRSSSSSACC
jgi:hypothetical protein